MMAAEDQNIILDMFTFEVAKNEGSDETIGED